MRYFLAIATWRYLAAPLYVWSVMAIVFGALWWQPYTGKGPPGTYREPTPPAPQLVKDEDRIISRPVKTVSYRLAPR